MVSHFDNAIVYSIKNYKKALEEHKINPIMTGEIELVLVVSISYQTQGVV